MKRIIVRETTHVPPFGEPARELRILNKPLWLLQRDLLARYCKGTLEVASLDELPATADDEWLIYRDNLFFNADLLEAFITQARASGHACQLAFARDDRAIMAHALPLQSGIREQGDMYVADMYYYPAGTRHQPHPLVIDTQAYEMGYYHIPSYMASNHGDLTFQVPNRVFLSIENWVHVYLANTPMGVFNWARQNDEKMQRGSLRKLWKWTREDLQVLGPKLKLVATALWERLNPFEEQWRNHFLSCKELVKVGKNCSIDPTAIIHGPTIIGDNVYIGPGTVITNSLIGNNVNIMQGSHVMLSVISDRCFLPFNAGVFMSTMMENSMVAQNTTLQVCVVGRNTFIGANNVFTDFHLLGQPIKTYHQGSLEDVAMPVLGSAVGHNCRIGSGFVFYPGRMIGSNTVLILDNRVNLINKSVNVPGIESSTVIPGHPHDDDEGETRQTIYRWPYLVDPDTGALHDPLQMGERHAAASDTRHTSEPGNGFANGDNAEAHASLRPFDDERLAELERLSSHAAHAHTVHVGG
jgi:acetyltransferase-like isoleucine patch superfamily enzyme